MTLVRTGRRILTGALLGLPAALLAHTVVFHGEHQAGGSFHGLLAMLAGFFGFTAALTLALLAVRNLRGISPRFAPIFTGAIVWFGGIEFIERDAGVPVVVALLALIACAWLVQAVLRAFAHTVAAIVCTLWCMIAKLPQLRFHTIDLGAPALQRPAYRFRVFSRPPPLHS